MHWQAILNEFRGGDVAQLIECWVRSTPQCSRGFFSPTQFWVQTLLRCLHGTNVQLCAFTSMHVLKIPSNDCHTFVWRHENTPYTRPTLGDGVSLRKWQGNSKRSHIMRFILLKKKQVCYLHEQWQWGIKCDMTGLKMGFSQSPQSPRAVVVLLTESSALSSMPYLFPHKPSFRPPCGNCNLM